MLRLPILFLLFTLSPILSANISPRDFSEKEHILPSISEAELLSTIILDSFDNSKLAPQAEVIQMAIAGYLNLVSEGKVEKGSPLSVIDFSLPSSKERLWIFDVEAGELLYHSLVSHGRNSGDLMARKFSNINSSFMSSLGFYVTGETYQGKHGYSLRLDGVEKGFNDRARERAIVIHGADYANREFVKDTGRLGRSLGCPALPMDIYKEVINTIKDGSCLFIYGNDAEYLNKSSLINA
jgi:hypothetical protein